VEVDPSAKAVIATTGEGLQRERGGDIPGAMAIYERALAIAEGDHAQCVAAHFMARHRADAAGELSWNLRALELARKVGDDRVAEYLASFNGCVGRSYASLGEPERARPYLEEGLRRLADVIPGDGYREDVERGIREMLKRVQPAVRKVARRRYVRTVKTSSGATAAGADTGRHSGRISGVGCLARCRRPLLCASDRRSVGAASPGQR
jgi:hypothetical protein